MVVQFRRTWEQQRGMVCRHPRAPWCCAVPGQVHRFLPARLPVLRWIPLCSSTSVPAGRGRPCHHTRTRSPCTGHTCRTGLLLQKEEARAAFRDGGGCLDGVRHNGTPHYRRGCANRYRGDHRHALCRHSGAALGGRHGRYKKRYQKNYAGTGQEQVFFHRAYHQNRE